MSVPYGELDKPTRHSLYDYFLSRNVANMAGDPAYEALDGGIRKKRGGKGTDSRTSIDSF